MRATYHGVEVEVIQAFEHYALIRARASGLSFVVELADIQIN